MYKQYMLFHCVVLTKKSVHLVIITDIMYVFSRRKIIRFE